MEKILILDYCEQSDDRIEEALKNFYNLVFVRDADQILSDDFDAVLLHLNSLDPTWNKNCLNRLDAIYGHGRCPIVCCTQPDNHFVEDALNGHMITSIVCTTFMNSEVLHSTLSNAIELHRYLHKMEDELVVRTRDLRVSKQKLSKSMEFVLNALGTVVEFRDVESGQHVKRVSKLTEILMLSLLMSRPTYDINVQQVKLISNAAAIHDLGKIAIPDSILNKPGKITKEEFEIMKLHTIYGCEILEKFKQDDSEFYKYCYDICRWHHERYDGKGYPDHLEGEDIPIWSQVAALADVIDALVSKRSYKEAYDIDESFDMIRRGECGQFSPQVISAMNKCTNKIKQVIEELS